MKFAVFIVFCGVLLHNVRGQTCLSPTYLYTDETFEEFDSHILYGLSNYHSDMHSCWVIEAPQGENVHLEIQEMDLASGCTEDSRDRVLIYDGKDGSAYLDKHLCGNDELYDYYTTGRYAYIEFITDAYEEREGFVMRYWHGDDDHDEEDDSDVGAIIGIVIGTLLGLAIIIALIIACVICCAADKKNAGKVHSNTPGQGTGYRYQTYTTQQYSTAGNQGGAVVMASRKVTYPTTKVAPGPGAEADQSHPVDANGVPMAAVYIEP